MKRELASTRTVFSTVMAALVFGFAAHKASSTILCEDANIRNVVVRSNP